MPSTYTTNNGIELIATGEQSGTWGTTTNTNLELLDASLDGQVTITLSSAGSSGSPNDLPVTNGSASNGRNRVVIFNDGGDLGATAYVQLTPNDAEKIVYIRNSLSGSRDIIVFQGTYNASNDYVVPNGTTAVVFFDGAGTGAVAANVFNNAAFDALQLGTSDVSVNKILDQDDMSGNDASALATQQSIKAYVDSQVGTVDTLAEVLANGNTTGGTDIAVGTGDDITFADNSRAIFGAGSDLLISSDGTASLIQESGPGALNIQGTHLNLRNAAGSSSYLTAVDGGAVTLFNSGSAKLATTSTGIDVTGTVVSDGLTVDASTAVVQASNAGGTTSFEISNTNGVSTANNKATLYLSATGAEANAARIESDFTGTVATNHAQDLKFYYVGVSSAPTLGMTLNSSGIDVTGTVVSDGLTVDGNLSVDGGTIKLDGNHPDGTNNVALGDAALDAGTTGASNTAIGRGSLTTLTSGSSNTAVGTDSLRQATTGASNTAIGKDALYFVTTGANNTAVGADSGQDITTATNNTLVGYNSGTDLSTGVQNTFIGSLAGDAVNTAAANVAVGYLALSTETKGEQSVAVGWSALASQNQSSSSNAYNTAVGSQAGRSVTTGTLNTIIGGLAGDSLTTSGSNVAVGYSALSAETAGQYSIAIGYAALASQNNTGGGNVYNVAIGYNSGGLLTTGTLNTFVGGLSGDATTTSSNNTGIGYASLGTNTTGSENTGVGGLSLFENTTGYGNTAVGYQASRQSTEGIYNTSMGQNALYANTTGSNNVAIGALALDAATTASNNTAVGYAAGGAVTTATESTLIGRSSGASITTGSYNTTLGYVAGQTISTGEYNVAVGRGALQLNATGTSNVALGGLALRATTVGGSVGVGYASLYSLTNSTGNTAVGYTALYSTTTGTNNTGVGYNVLGANTTGGNNTAVGVAALDANTTASNNTAVGLSTLSANTTGSQNTAIGSQALLLQTTSNNNTALGFNAGYSVTTGVENTFVGSVAGDSVTTGGKNTAVGFQALTNYDGSGATVVGTDAAQQATTATEITAFGAGAALNTTTGGGNAAFGRNTLYSNTTGGSNAAFGNQLAGVTNGTLYHNTTGHQNSAFGIAALRQNTTGTNNTAVGFLANVSNTTGGGNVAIGMQALVSNTTANNNTAVGKDALYSSTGLYNTAIGQNSGSAITTGTKNTILGSYNGNQGGLDIRTSSNYIVLSDGDGNPRQVIKSDGNTGIGIVNPSTRLHVYDSTTAKGISSTTDIDASPSDLDAEEFVTFSATAADANLTFSSGDPRVLTGTVNTDNTIVWRGNRVGLAATDDIRFFTSGASQRMRIDSSGNVFAGKSSSAFGTVGTELLADGAVTITRSGSAGGTPFFVNRLANDGEIAAFYKDGTQVGSIGTNSGYLHIGSPVSTDAYIGLGASQIYPSSPTGSYRDDAIDLGASSGRYKDIYATNGTIQTSDRNEKQDIEELSDAEQRVAVACKGLLRKYRWKSAVEEKGDDARIHFGIIAQDLQDAFTAEGLDAGGYGMFINSTWTDEETGEERSRMGVRYSELLAFIISAI